MKNRFVVPISLVCLYLLFALLLTSDAAAQAAFLVPSASTGAPAQPAPFDSDAYTMKTFTIATAEGATTVTCRYYEDVLYVARPVDPEYQSLDILVPIEKDGMELDASLAPILLNVGVSGYRAARDVVASFHGSARLGVYANAELALAAGYVVVSPSCRGRDNVTPEGVYYGKAPASIVDLKCAVKYLRHYDELIPGDAERIVACGQSAGGALVALLGTSGNSPLYYPYFKELGAAHARDSVFAVASYCPVTDLDHADMAYEWEFGATPLADGQLVDQEVSHELRHGFKAYQARLGLEGHDDFGTITADNYDEYLLGNYLLPAAQAYLDQLSAVRLQEYLEHHAWVEWTDGKVSFTWEDFTSHVTRSPFVPAFDGFSLNTRETMLFGDVHVDARHYTEFSLVHTNPSSRHTVPPDLATVVDLMNPMYFTQQNRTAVEGHGWSTTHDLIRPRSTAVADHWWIRHAADDGYTALPTVINLAAALENLGKGVDARLYWEAGHGANLDATDFISWMGAITAPGPRASL